MRAHETYLLSSNELRLIAAASGINSFLMFESQAQSSREEEIQSIFRLMNDGFLIGKGTVIEAGPSLAPLLKMFQCASTAIIARLVSHEAAPVCIYYDNSGEKFLCIIPHKHKEDFYEVSIVALDGLIEDFETLHFLPVLRDSLLIDSEIISDNRWDSEVDSAGPTMKENPLSTFEKFNLSAKELRGKASIIQTPFAWCLTFSTTSGEEHTHYSRRSFAAWLKGKL